MISISGRGESGAAGVAAAEAGCGAGVRFAMCSPKFTLARNVTGPEKVPAEGPRDIAVRQSAAAAVVVGIETRALVEPA